MTRKMRVSPVKSAMMPDIVRWLAVILSPAQLPQGSILGPLWFIFYINDLPDVYSLTQSLLFADDASIFCSHKDANHLVSIVNNELAKIIIWLKVNKLSLNLTKTNFMIFYPRQKKVNVNVPLTPQNTVIKQRHGDKIFRCSHWSVACEQQTHFRSLLLSLRKIASANPSGKTISIT